MVKRKESNNNETLCTLAPLVPTCLSNHFLTPLPLILFGGDGGRGTMGFIAACLIFHLDVTRAVVASGNSTGGQLKL